MGKKHSGDTFAMKPIPERPRRSVDIKKADNGFVVSSWDSKGEKLKIAKTQAEAQKIAAALLKI